MILSVGSAFAAAPALPRKTAKPPVYAAPRCGDGICQTGERPACGMMPMRCAYGDWACQRGRDQYLTRCRQACPQDCGYAA